MKEKNILDAIGGIDDELILDAAPTEQRKKKIVWHRVGAMAACLAVLTAGVLAVTVPFINPPIEPGPAETTATLDISRYTFATSMGIFSSFTEKNTSEVTWSERLVNVIEDQTYKKYYSSRVIDAAHVGKKLGSVTVKSYWETRWSDEEKDVEYLSAEIYEIQGVNPNVAFCLRYLDKGSSLTTTHYYTFINEDFVPSTLSGFYDAFALEKYLSVEKSAMIHSVVDGGVDYYIFRYDGKTANDIAAQLLSCDGDAVVLTEEAHEKIIKNCKKQARLRVDLLTAGGGHYFYITDNGYLLHVWNGIDYCYEIGAEKAKDIIETIRAGELYQAPSEEMTVTQTTSVYETSAAMETASAAETVNE